MVHGLADHACSDLPSLVGGGLVRSEGIARGYLHLSGPNPVYLCKLLLETLLLRAVDPARVVVQQLEGKTLFLSSGVTVRQVGIVLHWLLVILIHKDGQTGRAKRQEGNLPHESAISVSKGYALS